jgi:cobalt-zinc-cadmium efflux system outer membrane protein
MLFTRQRRAVFSKTFCAPNIQFARIQFTHIGLALTLSILGLNAWAATPNQPLSLRQAISQTLANNPQLYQYRFNQAALTAERQNQQLAPALNLELEVDNVAGSGVYQGADSAEATLALSSVIELGGKRSARVAVVDQQLNRAQFEQQAATLDVLGQLTEHYIQGLASQHLLALANEGLRLSQALASTVQERVNRGAAPEAELMRAKALVAEAKIHVNALQHQLARQKMHIARFWGDQQVGFGELAGDIYAFGESESFAALAARAQASPAIQIFASEARLQDAKLKLIAANNRSDLSWRLGIKRLEDSGDSALTASIAMPLFSNKRNNGSRQIAQAERASVDYQQQDALLQLRAQLYEAHSLRTQNLQTLQQIERELLPALEQALKLTRDAYNNGRYRYQDYLAAQEQLLAAKQGRINAAITVLQSQALIEQLTGETLQVKH